MFICRFLEAEHTRLLFKKTNHFKATKTEGGFDEVVSTRFFTEIIDEESWYHICKVIFSHMANPLCRLHCVQLLFPDSLFLFPGSSFLMTKCTLKRKENA